MPVSLSLGSHIYCSHDDVEQDCLDNITSYLQQRTNREYITLQNGTFLADQLEYVLIVLDCHSSPLAYGATEKMWPILKENIAKCGLKPVVTLSKAM